MSTSFSLVTFADTGEKVIGALIFPAGKVAGAASTVSGGTVAGSTAITAGATVVYFGLTETPAGSSQFKATITIGGTQLPDTTDLPYTVEARQVPAASNITVYANLAALFAASTNVVWTEEPTPSMQGGMLSVGVWGGSAAAGLTQQQVRDAMKLAPTVGAPAADSVDDKLDSGTGALSPDQADELHETWVGVQSIGAVTA